MNEQSDFEVLQAEIESLRKKVDQLITIIELVCVFVTTFIILILLINSSGVASIALVVILVITIALGLRRLEQRGI